MKRKIIACQTLENELNAALERCGCRDEVFWLEPGLHNYPDRLHSAIQEALVKCTDCDTVLLAMGFCGGSVKDLRTGDFRLVIPHVDDCISLLLGSVENRTEASDHGSTYFLTEGWLKGERNIWVEYRYTVEKYGERRGKAIFHAMFQHYRHLGLLDTGCYDMVPASAEAERIAEQLKLDLKILAASNQYLTELLRGDWDTTKFTVVPPHSLVPAY